MQKEEKDDWMLEMLQNQKLQSKYLNLETSISETSWSATNFPQFSLDVQYATGFFVSFDMISRRKEMGYQCHRSDQVRLDQSFVLLHI